MSVVGAVEVAGLTKRYGRIEALRGVDLAVAHGRVYGLLGPNGAGKSTLIRALVGSLRPTSGSVRVLGMEPTAHRAELRERIGYMPQGPALYDNLSAHDNVKFFGGAHHMPDLAERVREVLDFTELADRAGDLVYTYSGGMKRRVSLACALVHRPDVLFLDEPTAAVDPALRARFWLAFRDLAARGATLFISTHLMDEAMLCDEVAVLRQGRVIAADTPVRLLQRGRTRLIVRTGDNELEYTIGGRPEDLAAALQAYGLAPDVRSVEVRGDTLESVVLDLVAAEDDQ